MRKRDAFWQAIFDGEQIAWPSSHDERQKLASRILGASIIGAAEHVLSDALRRADGTPPEPGSSDYPALLRDAEVLQTLSPAQRDVVQRLLRRTAYFALYWPLVKAGNLPGALLDLTVTPTSANSSDAPLTLTDFSSPHTLFHQWVEEFGEILDREADEP
ncbi:MAG TPA: hypothetical protein VM686_16690 [Polyangiaceae bacterium]|nr:hypothetical protein [Polyangiaceae bacterium]